MNNVFEWFLHRVLNHHFWTDWKFIDNTYNCDESWYERTCYTCGTKESREEEVDN